MVVVKNVSEIVVPAPQAGDHKRSCGRGQTNESMGLGREGRVVRDMALSSMLKRLDASKRC